MTNARCESVVNCGMTNGTREAHCLEASVRVERAFHSQHGIELDESQCGCGVIEVYLALLDLIDQRLRESVHVHFQSDSECSLGANARTHATEPGALNCVMQF